MKLLWSHTDAIKVTSYIITSKEAGKKKSKLKPKKREDRLDKDGEAGGVSSMMLSVPIFSISWCDPDQFKMPCGTYDPL